MVVLNIITPHLLVSLQKMRLSAAQPKWSFGDVASFVLELHTVNLLGKSVSKVLLRIKYGVQSAVFTLVFMTELSQVWPYLCCIIYMCHTIVQ